MEKCRKNPAYRQKKQKRTVISFAMD
uniref:Uncharacterized protein n=1 Tax=Anguilla anguilla TaxID=7936 RepID=A0A0E9RF44_ANGAN